MRPETLSPLTADEHRELGRELQVAHRRLAELANVVVGIYGPNNQAAFSFARLVEDIDRLRRDLQAQAVQDLPGMPVDGFYVE
jgi:hypothetical protein